MQTSDWAEEAYLWYENYHDKIRLIQQQQQQQQQQETCDNENYQLISKEFFHDFIITDDLFEKFHKHNVLHTIDLLNWICNDYEIYEQERGWKPFIRRYIEPLFNNNESSTTSSITTSSQRILTLIRRDLLSPLDIVEDNNPTTQSKRITLVSRQQWIFIESLRWKLGYYHRSDVLDALRKGNTNGRDESNHLRNEDNNDSSAFPQLCIKNSIDCGRYVEYCGINDIVPGTIIFQAKPYVVAPYDVDPSCMTTCFHCGNRIGTTDSSKTIINPVRELTLQCSKCQIWSYCSIICKNQYETIHQKECNMISKLLDECNRIGMPSFKGLMVLRAIIRMTSEQQQQQQNWDDILHLQYSVEEHKNHNVEYTKQAEQISSWILQNCNINFNNLEQSHPTIDIQTIIRNLFFAININAIGLGSNSAAGLFVGIPSMINHSCNENVTHSYDHHDGYLRFRSNTIIQPGTECCYSYESDLHLSTHDRTKSLKQYKFFTCTCSRCISITEEDRIDSIQEWQNNMKQLEQHQENVLSFEDSVNIYRHLIQLSDIIFPLYHVTKGWIREECAHALLQDNRYMNESLDLLVQAKTQYVICRGSHSEFVHRVNNTIEEIQRQQSPLQEENNDNTSNNDSLERVELENHEDDNNNDLIFIHGWNHVIMEIKTYEPDDTDFDALSKQIKDYEFIQQDDNNTMMIRWSKENYRLYDIGYGIQSLILSCEINESICTREDIVYEIVEAFDDTIQHIDMINVNNEY